MARAYIGDARGSAESGPDTSPIITGPRGAVPGLSLAVVGPEGTRWAGGAGLADLATGAPATAGTVYPWFSMTKLATATAARSYASAASSPSTPRWRSTMPPSAPSARPDGRPPRPSATC
ncbi:MAG TPA: serine hydrolase [Thermomicrobiales bacterium]|nr:serine hydrolase [Thermomicrobiales bacterium]